MALSVNMSKISSKLTVLPKSVIMLTKEAPWMRAPDMCDIGNTRNTNVLWVPTLRSVL